MIFFQNYLAFFYQTAPVVSTPQTLVSSPRLTQGFPDRDPTTLSKDVMVMGTWAPAVIMKESETPKKGKLHFEKEKKDNLPTINSLGDYISYY